MGVPASGREVASFVARLAVLAGVYYVAARLSLKLSLIHENVTPFWPPTGIAVAAFLLFGRRLWPGVAVAAFAVNLPISSNALAAATSAAGNTLAPLVAAFLLDRVRFRREIDRRRDAAAIVFLGALGSMLISASIGAGTLVLSHAIPGEDFLSAWAVWWTGDAMGVLVVAPFLLTLGLLVRWRPTAAQRLEWIVTLLVIAIVTFGVMNSPVHLLPVVVPFLVWAAWRFEQRGAAPAALIVVGIASWAAAHGWAPFGEGTLFERMTSLQVFDATVAFSSLVFAALVCERSRARQHLERSAEALEERVRLRTDDLIRANEELAKAQRLASLGSWTWDVAADRVTWSDELYRIYGLRPDEFAATYEDYLERVHPDDRARVDQQVRAALATATPFAFEQRIVRPDGTERVLQARGEVLTDGNGTVVKMTGTGQDITERKQAEIKFEELLEASPDAIVAVDPSGTIRLVNRQTEALFGFPREELVGHPVDVLVPERSRDLHPTHRARYAATPGIRPMGAGLELFGRRKDGTEFPVDIALSPLETEEGVLFVAAVRDVTERKRAEREHRIAETLQRSLLPERLPEIPGVLLAARYVPASADMHVGGDWYDVVPLPRGRVGLTIGDVTGHGLRAASIMGQLRMAVRAYALEDASPSGVMSRIHVMVQNLPGADMATLIYGVYDAETSAIRFANAGHPAPLLVDARGHASYVESVVEPPLGVVASPRPYPETSVELAAGSTLIFFTDGLVERRGASIGDGLEWLMRRVDTADSDLNTLCDHLLAEVMVEGAADDIALLVLRPLSLTPPG